MRLPDPASRTAAATALDDNAALRSPRPDDNAAFPNSPPDDPYRPEPYCAVTIVCGQRQLDVALPTAVRSAELLPELLRLLLPGELPPDEQTVSTHPWVLTSIGAGALRGSETLVEAGILMGDVLILEQRPVSESVGPATLTIRDRIEDLVNGQARFWGQHAARRLAQWSALLTAGLLLIPALTMPAGPASALTAATVATVVTLTAALSGRRSETGCAAVGLTLGCGWAALSGADTFQYWADVRHFEPSFDPTAMIAVTLLVATGAALLLAGCAAISYPPALVHTTALLVVGLASGGVVIAISAGAVVGDAGGVAGLLAVLLIGALPRVALATGALTGTDPGRDTGDLDDRISRADRVLTGCLIGVAMVAALGVIPAALAGDSLSRALAIGIGALLLLRSRTFSQTRHVVAPRVGGLLVFGAVWLGAYRGGAAPQSALIIGAAVVTGALTAAIDVLERASSPVGRARRGRILDLAEQVLVVVLIVLAAWAVALAEWVGSVIG